MAPRDDRASGRERGIGLGVAALWVALGAGIAACAGTAGGAGPDAGPPRADLALLRIINHEQFGFRVHAVSDVNARILGQASSFDTTTFRLDPGIVPSSGRMFFVADPIGGPRLWRSEEVFVEDGDLVEWRLQGGPGGSRATIRVRRDAVREQEGGTEP